MLDGGLFAAINTTFKFVEFCYAIGDVPEENQVFIRLIQRVRDDLDECFRLLRNPAIRAHLSSDPGERAYIDGTIDSVRVSLGSIGKFVESVRVDEERNGTISLQSRFEWIMRHQAKLLTRQLELDTCHKSLLQGIAGLKVFLHTSTNSGSVSRLPSYGEATEGYEGEKGGDDLDFLIARKRRLRRERSRSSFGVDIPKTEDSKNDPITTIPSDQIEEPTKSNPSQPGQKSQGMSPVRKLLPATSHLHPNIAERGYNTGRRDAMALSPIEPSVSGDPFAPPRIPSHSTSSSQASTAFTMSDNNTSAFPSALPTPFFPPERPSSSYGETYSSQYLNSPQASEISEFGLQAQRPTSSYHLQHQNQSVASGISETSSSFSTYHQNFSVVSGLSELGLNSPATATYPGRPRYSTHQYAEPETNAPEVVPLPPPLPPRPMFSHPANSYPGLPQRTPSYSIPQVVPIEQHRHGSLPEVISSEQHRLNSLPEVATKSTFDDGIEVVMQTSLTRELREKRRARLNLISGG